MGKTGLVPWVEPWPYLSSVLKIRWYCDTLHFKLRLVRALAESGCISEVFIPQQLVILFRMVVRAFSTEVYTSGLRGWSGRNRSKFGKKKHDKKKNPQLNVGTSLADSYSSSQANQHRKTWDTCLMGCVRASGTPERNLRRPETTHEVYSWNRSCESAAQ